MGGNRSTNETETSSEVSSAAEGGAAGSSGSSAGGDAAGDAAAIAHYARELSTAVEEALGRWVLAAVAVRHPGPLSPELERAAAQAGTEAAADVGGRLRELLALDIDEQWTNPLAIIRTAVAYPTAVLAEAGVEPVARDATDVRINPDDVYALAPAAFDDLGPAVHEPGLVWGAAKAHLHLRRRRLKDSEKSASPTEGRT